ncbi:class I SAM-dependent methyltransferase [Arthrobacter sp. NPDC090010]|uniref:class I SAM-dependent methyltransferase n=1 Tax=Arthrobacter sp. NPDC090010 TaxID=3363942 RepID=UPI00381FDBCE
MNFVNMEAVLPTLRRWPDVEAENLQAFDGADRLLLEHARDHLSAEPSDRDGLVVIGDRYGALTLSLLAALPDGSRTPPPVRSWQDLATGQTALRTNAERLSLTGVRSFPEGEPGGHLYDEELLKGARLVLLRLPKNLAELAEISQAIARYADPGVTVLASGMVKHMSRSMNDVLGEFFSSVTASLARGKARVLRASGAREVLPGTELWPRVEHHPELSLDVVAHGAVFAGSKIDIGTRFLATFIGRMPQVKSIVDLGCGSGILTALAARAQPQARVLATDVSAAAVASARLTAEANGVGRQVDVLHADALEGVEPGSVDLVLLNPPFHLGHSVHAGAALKLFKATAPVLSPEGEVWTVWNSHLGYLSGLREHLGPTEVVGRNSKFTVTRSRPRVSIR